MTETPSSFFSQCFFNKDHLDFQCCDGGETLQTHVVDECKFLGKCCSSRMETFPDAASLRAKRNEMFVSMKEILDTIKIDLEKGRQYSVFSKKITEENQSFLKNKGYLVTEENGTQISWGTPIRVPPDEYTEKVIEIIKGAINRRPVSGTIGFLQELKPEVILAISKTFPNYYIFSNLNVIKYSLLPR